MNKIQLSEMYAFYFGQIHKLILNVHLILKQTMNKSINLQDRIFGLLFGTLFKSSLNPGLSNSYRVTNSKIFPFQYLYSYVLLKASYKTTHT